MEPPQPGPRRNGIAYAFGAFGIWGFLPFYLLLLRDISPMELVGWRAIWTLPACLLFVFLLRETAALRAALRQPKLLAMLVVSALLIGHNWLLYVWATLNHHVYAASLGYYINPLLNVLIGTIFLQERLTRRQWIAAGLAAVGVAILASGALMTLWISLGLACSFAIYGLIRKLIPVSAVVGLTIESIVLVPPGFTLILLATDGLDGSAMTGDALTATLVGLSGLLTAIPLYCFSEAARRMDYSTLGFFQFLVPTIIFISGLTVFHETLEPVQLASFVVIWAAIAVFCWDMWCERSARAEASEATSKA